MGFSKSKSYSPVWGEVKDLTDSCKTSPSASICNACDGSLIEFRPRCVALLRFRIISRATKPTTTKTTTEIAAFTPASSPLSELVFFSVLVRNSVGQSTGAAPLTNSQCYDAHKRDRQRMSKTINSARAEIRLFHVPGRRSRLYNRK